MRQLVLGPGVIVRSMSVPQPRGSHGHLWQYHSRSDLHSKVACWVTLVDLLAASAVLRRHAAEGKVVIGVNHEIRDFGTNRKKELDLVIGRSSAGVSTRNRSLLDLKTTFHALLTREQELDVRSLPHLREGPVEAVLMALEAKAAMTAHGKALPRLYDELTSSHTVIHGNSSRALAVALVMVNACSTFVSPGKKGPISRHRQPHDAKLVVDKLRELQRRTTLEGSGFDGLGVLIVSCANDGTPVTLVTGDPAPLEFQYANMITRVANEYDGRFKSI
jgi:hypothetical protein